MFFWTLALVLAADSVAQVREDLVLELEIPDAESQDSDVELVVTIKNDGEAYWVVYPNFFPETQTRAIEPWLRLRFEVIDDEGRKARHVGVSTDAKHWLPPPVAFLILSKGKFFGQRLSISDGPFEYSLSGRAPYRVKAVLESTARTWLQERTQEADSLPMAFELSRVFEGELESKEVVLDLQGAN